MAATIEQMIEKIRENIRLYDQLREHLDKAFNRREKTIQALNAWCQAASQSPENPNHIQNLKALLTARLQEKPEKKDYPWLIAKFLQDELFPVETPSAPEAPVQPDADPSTTLTSLADFTPDDVWRNINNSLSPKDLFSMAPLNKRHYALSLDALLRDTDEATIPARIARIIAHLNNPSRQGLLRDIDKEDIHFLLTNLKNHDQTKNPTLFLCYILLLADFLNHDGYKAILRDYYSENLAKKTDEQNTAWVERAAKEIIQLRPLLIQSLQPEEMKAPIHELFFSCIVPKPNRVTSSTLALTLFLSLTHALDFLPDDITNASCAALTSKDISHLEWCTTHSNILALSHKITEERKRNFIPIFFKYLNELKISYGFRIFDSENAAAIEQRKTQEDRHFYLTKLLARWAADNRELFLPEQYQYLLQYAVNHILNNDFCSLFIKLASIASPEERVTAIVKLIARAEKVDDEKMDRPFMYNSLQALSALIPKLSSVEKARLAELYFKLSRSAYDTLKEHASTGLAQLGLSEAPLTTLSQLLGAIKRVWEEGAGDQIIEELIPEYLRNSGLR